MTIKEFEDNMVSVIVSMGGLNPDFIKNPAFTSCIVQLNVLIDELKIKDRSQITINVDKDNKKISFDLNENQQYDETINDNVKFEIDFSGENNFKCTTYRSHDNRRINGPDGGFTKEAVEVGFEFNPTNYKQVVISSKDIIVAASNPNDLKVSSYSTLTEKSYDKNGINVEVNMLSDNESDRSIINGFSNLRGANGVISACYPSNFVLENCNSNSRLNIQRNQFDTAIVNFQSDKISCKNAEVPLNSEHGLREMSTEGIINLLNQKIVISPLTDNQINELINKEENPIVREGLKAYLMDREHYYYNSETNTNYYFENKEDSINRGI